MLELDLPAIAATLPDDDVPRWFVVPQAADEAETQVWATAMAEILTPDFADPDDPESARHLHAVLESACRQPRVEPFDQRLLYLPYGASTGLVVDLLIVPAEDSEPSAQAAHTLLLGPMADGAEPVLDDQERVIGMRRLRVVSEPGTAYSPEGSAPFATNPAVFWSVQRRTVAGRPADVVATGASPDVELAALGMFALAEVLQDDALFE
jgi:hypothetical protein